MIGTPEQDAFISRSFSAIASTVRADGTVASSMIFYGRDGDRLWFSTVQDRVKGRTIARDPRITICIANTNEPNSFVTVQGSVEAYLDNPAERREAVYPDWGSVTRLHPAPGGHNGGRESTEALFTQRGRAVYAVTPRRVSGELLDPPVE